MSPLSLPPSLLLLLLLLPSLCSATADADWWQQLRQDVAEYEMLNSTKARSVSHCTAQYLQHDAVQFESLTGDCRSYRCLRGATGCRKCRKLENSSMTVLWVKTRSPTSGCWRTFQHRVDASVDFYRNWTDYLSEFGQGPDRNYWMGLHSIHLLAKDGDRRVRWEFSDWNDTFYWAENEFLRVEGESVKFRATIGPLDASSSSVGQCTSQNLITSTMFSTADSDNDNSTSNCAVKFQGAWWYFSCHCFNPNGKYFTPPKALYLDGEDWADGMTYHGGSAYPLTHNYAMKTFECMVWVPHSA